MADSYFIEHKNRKIYYIDFTNSSVVSINNTVEKAKADIASQPEGTVLTMTNVRDAHISQELSNLMVDLTRHNKPYVKAGAVLGVTGIKNITFNTVLESSGRRNLHLFDSMDEAKDWLIKQ